MNEGEEVVNQIKMGFCRQQSGRLDGLEGENKKYVPQRIAKMILEFDGHIQYTMKDR